MPIAMLIAATLTATPVQMVMCVDVPAGKTAASMDARGEAWFVKGAPLTIGKARYAQAGARIGMAPNEIALVQRYGDANVYARIGDAGRDTLYVLADIRDCTFQPYRRAR